jgi:P pilus assembly chaperone PapD
MARIRCLWLLFAVTAALLALPVHATLQLDRNVVYLDRDDEDRQDVVIRNPDADTMYLDVDVVEVLRPGEPDEELIRTLDAHSMDLLVTPSRLVVPPGGQRLLRLVQMAAADDRERVFRVAVTPEVSEITPLHSAVNAPVTHEVLVIVAPQQQRPALVAAREGASLEFQNLGNANVLLYRGIQCADAALLDTPDHAGCRPVNGTRLYAGNRWRPALPYDTPVEFIIEASGRNQRQRF